MIITILLVVLIVMALSGSFYGYNSGWYTPGAYNPIGLILVVIIILLLVGLLTGPVYRYW